MAQTTDRASLAAGARRGQRQLTVADAMVTRPAVHPPWTTIGQLHALFTDDHVHMALLVDRDELVGTVERGDLASELGDRTPASEVAVLAGRTIAPDATLADALALMRHAGRRRLAVTSESSLLLGLLCLKESGLGFCSDSDVESRASQRAIDCALLTSRAATSS